MIKIRLMILDNDRNYIERIVSGFNIRYKDKFEIYSFTNLEVAMQTLDSNRIDVFLSSEEYIVDISKLPDRCAFAYLTESNAVETVLDQRAICKYQKADLLYKEIINLHSEKTENILGYKIKGGNMTKVITFTSPGGGTGTSSMAVACAINFAKREKKVLYLNFEQFGKSSLYFKAEGQSNLSDVIYSIKSNKANMSLRLESIVRFDDRYNVYFYESCNLPLDILELTDADIVKLISGIKNADSYDYIIIDIDFDLSPVLISVMEHSTGILCVSDGTEVSNSKFNRAYEGLEVIEKQKNLILIPKLGIIYNKFSNRTSKSIENESIQVLGGVPKYEHANSEQIVQQLSSMAIFDGILKD